MDKEFLIEALIYHGPGGCPRCSGRMYLCDRETTFMEINEEGIPFSEDTKIQCQAVCVDCGNKIQMFRHDGKYLPYGRSAYILKSMENIDRNKDRVRELNANSKNPFE